MLLSPIKLLAGRVIFVHQKISGWYAVRSAACMPSLLVLAFVAAGYYDYQTFTT